MHAAKHFDPELGIDIHLYLIPPSPVPVPLPTPHIGIVLDPFDYLPIIGGTVHVNGVKRATAGTGGLDVHIPVGGMWAPPFNAPMGPQYDGEELFMGSMTVLADGDPLSRITMPVLDCNIVGMINPFRPKKPAAPQRSMSLPTAINLAIPNHVQVGGPPMISIMGMAFKGLFAGLGALRRSARFQNAMERFRNFRRAHFGDLPPGFLKCRILRAEPVDIRRGTVSVAHEDFAIPGRLPLAWTRRYGSGDVEPGLCGPGWRTPADTRLELHPGGAAVYRHADGTLGVFARVPAEGEPDELDGFDGARLARDGATLRVRTKDDLVHVFAALPAGVVPLREPIVRVLERLEDRCGNHWRFERIEGRLVRLVESGIEGLAGRIVEVDAAHGRINRLELHDPATGRVHPLVRYAYDAAGDLVAAHDALDAPRRFAYREHRMVRHTDRVGLSFHYAFDEQWRVVHAWGDGGLHDYRFRYDELLNETELTDSLGHVSIVKFDADGLPLAEIDPLGGMTVFEYDEAGRTTAITDPAGLRTEFAYDEAGNLVGLKRPDDTQVAMAYEDGKLVETTDPDGGRWQQVWDQRGLIVSQTTPMGAKTLFEHDAHGQLRRRTNARGAVTRLDFDRHGQLRSLTDALGHVTRFEHDALGRLLARTDAMGRTTTHAVDAKGRMVEVRLPGGAVVRCEHDPEDQLVRWVDERGGVTAIEYSGIGQIARRVQPDGHAVRYVYDTEEQLVGVVNQRGETYRIVRDPLGRIVEEADYWGQSRHYGYDGAGRLVRSCDALGRSVEFTCDALGRIVAKAVRDPADPTRTVTETFRYGKSGQLLEARNAVARVIRRYDADHRVTEERQNGFSVANSYDETGNRILRKTSAGNVVAVTFDACDQPASIAINQEHPITIERNALGQAIRETLGPRIERTSSYEFNGLLARQAAFLDGVPLFDTRWTYDLGGNIVHRADSEWGSDRYAYDPAGRVQTHTDSAGRLATFAADPAGDRLRTRVREMTALQSVGGVPSPSIWTREGDYDGCHYVFDRAGNLASRVHRDEPGAPELQLEWNPFNRLVSTRWQGGRSNGEATTYGYDPLGRRVFKRGAKSTTWFFWDGDALLGEAQMDGAPSAVSKAKVVPLPRRQWDASGSLREYVLRPGTFEPLAIVVGTELPLHTLEPVASVAEGVVPDAGSVHLGPGMLGSSVTLDGGFRLDGATSVTMNSPQSTSTDSASSGDVKTVEPGVFHFHNGPNGSPMRLTNSAGRVFDVPSRVERPLAGRGRASVQDVFVDLQGQYFDAESGLDSNGFRYFDPRLECFISPDPIGLASGENLYAFAPNTGVWIDPLGLASSNPGVYDVFFEAYLPQSMYRLTDAAHFSEANRQLFYAMKNDAALQTALEARYPGIFDYVSPTRLGTFRGRAFSNVTWHHHADVGGLLQLVDTAEHSSRHLDFHARGVGGRNTWGGGTTCR